MECHAGPECAFPLITEGLRSRHGGVRAAWFVGLIIATFLVVLLAGMVSAFPTDYAWKQDDSASALRRLSAGEWRALRRATLRDMFVFVPIYLLWGLTVAGLVRAARSTDQVTPHPWWVRIAKAPRTLVCAVLGLALADLAETVLFRRSLTRLTNTMGAGSVDSLTRATQTFTGLKFVALVTALCLLAYQVLTRRGIAAPAADG